MNDKMNDILEKICEMISESFPKTSTPTHMVSKNPKYLCERVIYIPFTKNEFGDIGLHIFVGYCLADIENHYSLELTAIHDDKIIYENSRRINLSYDDAENKARYLVNESLDELFYL